MLDEIRNEMVVLPLNPHVNNQPFRPTYEIGSMLFMDAIIFLQASRWGQREK
jgi:hypothetical protein